MIRQHHFTSIIICALIISTADGRIGMQQLSGKLDATESALTTYQAEKESLAQKAQALIIPEEKPTASETEDLSIAPTSLTLSEKPISLSDEQQQPALPDSTEQILFLFAKALKDAYGEETAHGLLQKLFNSQEHLTAIARYTKAHPHEIAEQVRDQRFIMTLLHNPATLNALAPMPPKKKSGLKQLLNAMAHTKKYFSVAEWGNMMQGLIGNLFRTGWHQVWRITGKALVVSIGKEKVYQLNPDGSIKTDGQGRKIPALVKEFGINEMGQPGEILRPNKWYSLVENEQELLGQIAQSGINKATKSTLQSLDRLLLRPLVYKMLDIPEWKLSYTHYLLATHEQRYPKQTVLDPAFLAEKILASKNPKLLLNSSLPFNLNRILQMKDEADRMRALQTAITKHIWEKYEKIWDENKNVLNQPQTKEQHENSKIEAAQTIGKDILNEAKKIGKDSLKGKLMDGPLLPVVIYGNLGLQLAQKLVHAFSSEELPATEGFEDKMKYIQILSEISKTIRNYNEKKSNEKMSNSVAPTSITIEITSPESTDSSKTISIAPITQKRLLAAQEQLLGAYGSYLEETLKGDSYPIYFKRLIFPRIIFKFFNGKLGIKTLADASKKMRSIEKYFSQTYAATTTLTNLLAIIKRFERYESFAGHYVEIADVVDRFFMSISELMETFDVQKDDWSKRFKTIVRKTYGRHISKPLFQKGGRLENVSDVWPFSLFTLDDVKLFNNTQRQQITRAFKKAGIHDGGLLLLDNESALKGYISGEAEKNTLTYTFSNTENKKTEEYRIKRANDIQGTFDSKKLEKYKLTEPISLKEFKKYCNDQVEELLKTPEQMSEVAERATKVLLQTAYTLTVRKNEQEDKFFNDGTAETIQNSADNIKKMGAEINSSFMLTLSHVRASIEALNSLYSDYGLREILFAFDEHYEATGEKMLQIPLAVMGEIALREGTSHAVGLGAQFLLKKATTPIINRIIELQGNALFGGPAMQGMLMGQISKLIGGDKKQGNAYKAARALAKNIFMYGSETALKTENIIGSVGMPLLQSTGLGTTLGLGNGMGKGQDLMFHAKMAAESGKTPTPSIAKKLKSAGLNPEMFSAQQLNISTEPGFPLPDQGDEGEQAPEGGLSPKVVELLGTIEKISAAEGEEAAVAFIKKTMPTLSPQEQQEVMMILMQNKE